MTSEVQFGKYRLIEPLAQGGMAELFLAKQQGPGGFEKTVVIKRVLAQLASDEDFIHMFLDEARLAAQLSHPNVVEIFDFGEEGGSYYLAMELLRGHDLGKVLEAARGWSRPVPGTVAAHILSAVCDALQYAHTFVDARGRELLIVHRDVSPSNIFLTHQGAVKVLDFGIAKAEGKLVQTQAGVVKGKFLYMSPEQARGEKVDGRSDVFAMGAVLYELITGVTAFEADSQLALLRAVMEGTVVPPHQKLATVDRDLEAIVVKAMQPDLALRYPSAQALRDDLEAYLTQRPAGTGASQIQTFVRELLGDPAPEPAVEPPRPQPQARAFSAPASLAGPLAMEQTSPSYRIRPVALKEAAPAPVGSATEVVSVTPVETEAVRAKPAKPSKRPRTAPEAPARKDTPPDEAMTLAAPETPPTPPPEPAAPRRGVPLLLVVPAVLGVGALVVAGALWMSQAELAQQVKPLERPPPPVAIVPPPASKVAEPVAVVTLPPKPVEKEPRVAPKPAPRPAVASRAGMGRLTLTCKPECKVTLKGKVIGISPLKLVELPVGPHTLELTSVEGLTTVDLKIQIEAGKLTRRDHVFAKKR